MKNIGSKALDKIQKLITTTIPKSSLTPKKIKKQTQNSPFKIKTSPTKPDPNTSSKKAGVVYIPMQKQIKMLEKQKRMMYDQLEKQTHLKLQNPHSFFLNQKNPRPPIYERAQEIVRQRQAILQQKRQRRQQEKEDQEQREYLQYLKEQPPKKIISKEEAMAIGDKMYREHYSRTTRLNTQKIKQFKEQAKNYRVKPAINQTSKQLYHKIAEKNQLQGDIITRFEQYQAEKKEVNRKTEKAYKDRYYPFKPMISDQSRIISSTRKDSNELSKREHCSSCNFIKQESQKSEVKSPSKFDETRAKNATISSFQYQ